MTFDFSVLWHYDSATLLLLSFIVLLYTLRSHYLAPIPLAHPILLGRQSDISKVRRSGETATYRNQGVGHDAPLPAKPRKDIIVVHDFIQSEMTHKRVLWNTKITNEELKKRTLAVGRGLVKSVGLVPEKSNAVILMDDCFEWILVDLALSSIGVTSLTPTKLNLLSPILDHHSPDAIFTEVSLLEAILEQVAELGNHFPIVLVGKNAQQKAEASRNIGFNVVALEEVEIVGKDLEPIDVAPQPNRTFSTSFFSAADDVPSGVHLTHQNLTAGPTAVRQFFTLTTPLDREATVLSAFPLASAFGRAVAYTAIFEGCNFRTFDSTSILKATKGPLPQTIDELVRGSASDDLPRPTHLFITPSHLESLTSTIKAHASSSFFANVAWTRKLIELAGGSITETSAWDSIGRLSEARRASFGLGKKDPWIKAVIVAGGPSSEELFPTARLVLSVPLINAHIEPISTAPIFASHPFDLQHFPITRANEVAHVGPPAANVEIKLVAVSGEDATVNDLQGDPVGKLHYRGPSVGEPVPALPSGSVAGEWVDSGRKAMVHSNGTFRILA